MPIPLIIAAAVLLLLALLLALRVRLTLTMRENVTLDLGVLFLRFRLFPRRKKIKPEKAKKPKKKAAREEKHKKEHEGGEQRDTLRDKIRLARALTAVLIRRTRKYLRLRAARLRVRVATGDAAGTALLYGVVSQSLSYLLAALGRVTRLKAAAPEVAVEADFLGERSSADVKLIFSISVFGALASAISLAFAYFGAKRAPKTPAKPSDMKENSDQNKKGT